MASRPLRLGACGVVGLFAGLFLGFLVAPDPTGPLGPVLGIVLAAAIGAGLYRSDFLREPDPA